MINTYYYQNQSDRSQILRVSHPQFWVEKVICSGQTVCFEANRNSRIEIYSYLLVTMMIEEIILAEHLPQIPPSLNKDFT
jgi:hypothetical protein